MKNVDTIFLTPPVRKPAAPAYIYNHEKLRFFLLLIVEIKMPGTAAIAGDASVALLKFSR